MNNEWTKATPRVITSSRAKRTREYLTGEEMNKGSAHETDNRVR
jgi:predicted Ser/Thr protein kinase